jgi:Protein of unknown function (DUF2852)
MMSFAGRLDELPRPIWVALAILGFVFWWPLGIAILAILSSRDETARAPPAQFSAFHNPRGGTNGMVFGPGQPGRRASRPSVLNAAFCSLLSDA